MGANKTVLVVEDDHFLSDIYKHQLQEQGCLVSVAADGAQAMEALDALKPDVILLDLIMPGMNGFEFLEALRAQERHKDRRVIVLSNLGQEGDKERCAKLGVAQYLVKTQVSVDEVVADVLQ